MGSEEVHLPKKGAVKRLREKLQKKRGRASRELIEILRAPLRESDQKKSEFLDLYRRVLIPEALIDLFHTHGKSLPTHVYTKLQTRNALYQKAIKQNEVFKLSEKQIKDWREFLNLYMSHEQDGWSQFCSDYLHGRIENIWDETCEELGARSMTLRSSDLSPWLDLDPVWHQVTDLVGKFGVGSFDAMIINLFLNSKFSSIITADKDIAYVIEKLKPDGKFVIVPDLLRI